MQRFVVVLLAALVALCVGGCAPRTRLVATWKPPTSAVTTPIAGPRPLVVFQHPSVAVRRTVEDALAARIPGAVQSYRVLTAEDINDVERMKERIRDAGWDTLVLGHLVDVRTEIDVVPTLSPGFSPVWGDPMWGTWNSGWGTAWQTNYLEETQVVTLETLFYALDPGLGDGELLWAGRSETFDPRTFEDLGSSVAKTAVEAMEDDGVVLER